MSLFSVLSPNVIVLIVLATSGMDGLPTQCFRLNFIVEEHVKQSSATIEPVSDWLWAMPRRLLIGQIIRS